MPTAKKKYSNNSYKKLQAMAKNFCPNFPAVALATAIVAAFTAATGVRQQLSNFHNYKQ